MTALLLAAMLGHVNVKHACYVADQFQDVNIPIEPARSSTEVSKVAVVIGRTMLGSALTLRNGKHYFADLASQQPRSAESYALLRALGIQHPEATFAGTIWPVKKPIPSRFFRSYRVTEETTEGRRRASFGTSASVGRQITCLSRFRSAVACVFVAIASTDPDRGRTSRWVRLPNRSMERTTRLPKP